jgi:preprotein translocase subunit SecG
MYIALIVVHVLVSFVIMGVVLLQAGKGADIGSAFGGGASQAVFGSMSTPTVLGKITTVVAAIFVITSFTLAMLAARRPASVMTAPPAATQTQPPSAPAPAPTK